MENGRRSLDFTVSKNFLGNLISNGLSNINIDKIIEKLDLGKLLGGNLF